jgi:hypothetical protein
MATSSNIINQSNGIALLCITISIALHGENIYKKKQLWQGFLTAGV